MADDNRLPLGYSVHAGRDALVAGRDIIVQYFSRNGTVTDGLMPEPLMVSSGGVTVPYRGLSPFREDDEALFFGRREAAARVLELLSEGLSGSGLVVVSGVSGAGKSSLLRAGVLPRLRRGGLAGAPSAGAWPCLVLSPSGDPLGDLAGALSVLLRVPAGALRAELAADPANFTANARRAALPPPRDGHLDGSEAGETGSRLLVVVDQCEKLFTQCTDERRHAFLSALYAASAGESAGGRSSAAIVVLAVRADFEARLAEYRPQEFPELGQAVQDRFLLRAMEEWELRLAITGPAGEAGFAVEESLVQVLLAEMRASAGADRQEAGAGSLPLLSHALDQTWRARAGQDLQLADYEKTGGIHGAVARTAQDAYDQLSSDQQQAARGVFTRLVAVGADGADTAVRRLVTDLAVARGPGKTADADAVLEAFASRRLLTMAAGTVEISHESLITAWPLLRDTWLAETRDARRARTRLRDTAAEWGRRPGDSSYLYRGSLLQETIAGTRLADGGPAVSPPLSELEERFLAASRHVARRAARGRRALIAVLAAFALAASVAFVVAARQGAAARQQRDQAIRSRSLANYQQIMANALGLVNASVAAQLELTAYRIAPVQDVTSRLLNTEDTPLPTRLTGPSAPVDAVACSPDGRVLASGSSDGTIQLWDIADPARPRPLQQPFTAATGAVYSVAFSPRGAILATGSGDGAVRLWDVSDPANPAPLGQPFAGSASYVLSVAFSGDGRELASGGSDGTVHVWDLADRARPRPAGSPVTASTGSVNAVAFSRDGRTLASGGSDGTLRLWKVAGHARIVPLGRIPAGSAATVSSLTFSPDGRTLASGGGDGAVRMWDVANPGIPRQFGPSFTSSTGTVESVAFSPDAGVLATGGSDGETRLWNVANPAAPQSLGPALTGPAGAASSIAFSSDGRTLAVGSADRSVWLFSLPATILTGHTARVDTVAFSPDGRMLASGSDDETLRLWDVASPDNPRPLGLPLTGPTAAIESVAFSPDSRTLAAGSFDGTVRLLDTADLAHPRWLGPSLPDTGGDVLTVAFSPDGRLLAVGDTAHSVQLWDVANPSSPHRVTPDTSSADAMTSRDDITSVAFSPDGKVLASGSYDRTVTFWDVTNPGHPQRLGVTPWKFAGPYIRSVAFSPGGHLLADGIDDGTVQLWDVTHPAHPVRIGPALTGPTGAVNSVAFSQDGSTLAAGSSDGATWRWNVANPLHPHLDGVPLSGSGAAITSVAFGPDGHTLASGGYDNTIRLWNLSVTDATRRICTAAGNALSPELWQQYVPLAYQPPCGTSTPYAPPAVPVPSGAAPPTPAALAATPTGPRTIVVAWAPDAGTVTGYNIDNGCPVAPVLTCGGSDAALVRTTGTTTSAVFDVTPGSYSCFRVQAFSDAGASHFSGYQCAQTPPLKVAATREWTDTGVNLTAGARLYIKAYGQVLVSPAAIEGPAGDPTCTPIADYAMKSSVFPAPTLPCWSLVARIGNGPPFEVGSSTLVITTPGRLYLGLNAGSFSHNLGSWLVFMSIGGPVTLLFEEFLDSSRPPP